MYPQIVIWISITRRGSICHVDHSCLGNNVTSSILCFLSGNLIVKISFFKMNKWKHIKIWILDPYILHVIFILTELCSHDNFGKILIYNAIDMMCRINCKSIMLTYNHIKKKDKWHNFTFAHFFYLFWSSSLPTFAHF
jgi:hypothetical protein